MGGAFMFERIKKFCDSFLDIGIPGFDLVVYKDGLLVGGGILEEV